jgi:hypothetical protein
MKHIYTNWTYYYVEESEEDCVKSFEYENDVKTQPTDWHQLEDDKQFNIMFRWNDDGGIDSGNIVLPENRYQEKIDEDNWYDDYGWSVYAKAKDWAEVNSGELCHEI